MLANGDGGGGNRRAVAATVAVATSTAMFEAGEMGAREYAEALVLSSAMFDGSLPLVEGWRVMMGLWMGPVMANGCESSSH